MQVVITGASGFLGYALLRRLTDAGIRCIATSRRSIAGFVCVNDYSEAPGGDILVHLAETNDRALANRFGEAGEEQAQRTLGKLLAKGYAKIIYASSAVLYGDDGNSPHLASDPVRAVDSYTRIKLASERAVLERDGVVARFANLYGPGMPAVNVLSDILRQLEKEGPLVLRDTRPIRDFLWMDDAADAIARMATANASGIFNVGSGIGTSIRELAVMLLAMAGQPARDIASTKTDSVPSYIVTDISKTTEIFGWRPTTMLRAGLRQLLDGKAENT